MVSGQKKDHQKFVVLRFFETSCFNASSSIFVSASLVTLKQGTRQKRPFLSQRRVQKRNAKPWRAFLAGTVFDGGIPSHRADVPPM